MEYVGNIIYDNNLLDKDRKFVIFGAGRYGRKILKYMDLNGVKESVICFCDSDIEIEGQHIEGIPVCQIKDAIAQYSDAEYMVGGKYSKEMYHILDENLIRKIHILFI